MKHKVFLVMFSFIIVLSLVLASCTTKITSTPLTTTSQSTAASTASTTVQSNGWGEVGTPQYGGTITLRTASLMTDLDPYSSVRGLYSTYSELLFQPKWTTNRSDWAFSTMFTPPEYLAGLLAESWEQTDPSTLTVHLRQGIHWQNKAPTNGRELTANDIQYHYDRILGTGSGFTEPSAFNSARLAAIAKVTAVDTYTVQIKYKSPGAIAFFYLLDMGATNTIEAPEWVKLSQQERENWQNAVGTGAWILTDWVSSTSATYSSNPNYWGYDERYPNNKLPYAENIKEIQIPDTATALASMRTGKIDILDSLLLQQAQSIAKTNPEILQGSLPSGSQSLDFRWGAKPFDDIKVRKAMQLAIDTKTIAATHYGGKVNGTPCGLFNSATAVVGYGFAYEDWPQSLKDEYSYNPEKAQQLLAEAGYPNGFKTNVVAASSGDTELMQIFKSELMNIGIDMEINLMDDAAYNGFVVAGKQDQMDWDSMGKSGAIINVVMIIGLYRLGEHANFAKVDDTNYNSLVENFFSATTLDEAKQVSKQIDQYQLEQHWAVSACPTVTFNIWQPYLKGYGGEALGAWTQGLLFARLWVDQDVKKSLVR